MDLDSETTKLIDLRHTVSKQGNYETMKFQSNATSWAFILSAATSLVLMVCLLQIDSIIRGTLYDYGLRFSYNWASPYLRLTQIGFAAGWINIITAFAVQLNNLWMKHKAERPLTATERAWETAKIPETEKAPEEGLKEHKDTERTKSPEEAPEVPGSETEEKKEESQRPEQAPEQKPQQPEQAPEQESQQRKTKPEETPSLVDLFQ